MFAIGRSEILEQFNFMSGRFDDRDQDFSAFNSGDLLRQFTDLMRAMRKLKAEDIAPESERAFEVRDRDSGVVSGDDAK